MNQLARARLRLPGATAPGGLVLVQELINTSSRPAAADSSIEDLLASEDAANRWLQAALGQWSSATGLEAPDLSLSRRDLSALRRFRESIRTLAGHGEADTVVLAPAPVALELGADGRIVYTTTAAGWRGVAALVLTELLLAQRTGVWRRLKACAYPSCGIAFYDASNNNSRIWHDVRTCGNRTNLAAARRRRRGDTP
ncbi:CGNR zinc finger domain-containing protein [Streptomyces sp. NPDC026659]|uniref:CGNR zinc finger domain-containing protein n=1 Tax=Streptomyces sp. NPDC026659 TaxID=3155123 RepID=UPI0033CAF263